MFYRRRYEIGDSCVCWSLGDVIDTSTSEQVLRAYRALGELLGHEPGVRDLVPSYTALALHVDPLVADVDALCRIIETVLNGDGQAKDIPGGQTATLPVSYTGQDLDRVSRITGLSVRQVIERHTAPVYTVAMIGFMPHFPYLIGLDPAIETPRLECPRKTVPAGAVAIGGAQAGVYPSVSPGGWNIIGLTDPSLLITLAPGDRVVFEERT